MAGQSVGLVGNNGAGKTTFLRLLLDLIEPDEGHVCVGGHAVNTDTTWKSFTGSYLDDSFLVDFVTPDEFIAFVGSVYRLSPEEQAERLAPFQSFYTDEPLGRTTKYLRDLSQGNRKKVGIIAAMFIQPRVLVLDEPFANLDPRSQLQLMRLLRQAQATHGTTLLISSHDLGHVTDVCERIAVIEDPENTDRAEIVEARLDWNDTAIEASGNLGADAQGYLTGDLTMDVQNLEARIDAMREAGWIGQDEARFVIGALALAPRTDSGAIQVPIQADGRRVMAFGFVALFDAPRIYEPDANS